MDIKNFKIIEENGWTKVQTDVTWGENNHETAYFAVPNNLSNELDITCADNFLICYMLLAFKNDEDIHIQGAGVSKTLVNNIYNVLLPSLATMGCGTNKTKIYANFVEDIDQRRGNYGATGISLGVDSFYSILKNKNHKIFPINTVLYIQQLDTPHLKYNQNIQGIFDCRNTIANDLNIRFIPILTNSRCILDKEFVFTQYHTYCHLGAANTIKSIGCYYYATAFHEKDMKLCFNDTGYYDNIISKSLVHSNFMMKMSGDEATRYEKTKLIADNIIVQKNLDVCLKNEDYYTRNFLNCSKCPKCIRTLATLEVLNKLSNFNNIFDIELYLNNRSVTWGELEYRRLIMHDIMAKEIIAFAHKGNLVLPKKRWLIFLFIGIKNQLKKIKRKINP